MNNLSTRLYKIRNYKENSPNLQLWQSGTILFKIIPEKYSNTGSKIPAIFELIGLYKKFPGIDRLLTNFNRDQLENIQLDQCKLLINPLTTKECYIVIVHYRDKNDENAIFHTVVGGYETIVEARRIVQIIQTTPIGQSGTDFLSNTLPIANFHWRSYSSKLDKCEIYKLCIQNEQSFRLEYTSKLPKKIVHIKKNLNNIMDL